MSGTYSNVVQFPAPRQEEFGRTPITAREAEVLELVARDMQNKEIAAVLGCAPATVKQHLRLAFQRLGVRDREAAVEVWRGLSAERRAA